MMLWNIIRDFFVKYVFGGFDSNFDFYETWIGSVTFHNTDSSITHEPINGVSLGLPIGATFNGVDGMLSTDSYITISDWLSTTATIITLIVLFIGITLLIIKLFRFVSNLFLLR